MTTVQKVDKSRKGVAKADKSSVTCVEGGVTRPSSAPQSRCVATMASP